MAFEKKITTFFDKRKWIIPFLFGFMCACLICCFVGLELKGLKNLEQADTFNVSGEICAIFASVMITLSILPSYKRATSYKHLFVATIATLCFTMASDCCLSYVNGNPDFRWATITLAIITFINEVCTLFFFWLYATHVLKSEGKLLFVISVIAGVLLVAFILIPVITSYSPLYFEVDSAGFYHRIEPQWWISRIYHTYIAIAGIIALILSKSTIKTKIIISVFMGLPLIAMASGGYKTGTAVQYIAMTMSIILIFAFVFSDNEKDLYSTNKELSLATNIQKNMLPTIFPPFPNRNEIDIFASMTPAKEVGGDFYDFFLIDNTHLGLVIADVSDKGVPAALFMMASKIMVNNYAMLSKSPSEVLTLVNNQICQNNQDQMFVTIWLGVLDLKTGILTASNAGHEKPIIKSPKGKFELYKDKNGFVVGWYKNMNYTDYQIQLEKGSKIFLYTDGVPEATAMGQKFGIERMVASLNKHKDLSPTDIVTNMKADIDEYVGKEDQFDDITMLCLEFADFYNEEL